MNRLLSINIEENFNNKTIKSVLMDYGFSSALIKSLKLSPDSVKVNETPKKLIDTVHLGDILTVLISEPSSNIKPVRIALDILYEDEDIILINKPRNMPTHPSHEHTDDTLANALMHHFNSKLTFHPITRLDKDTSGVVLVAKNALSAKLLTDSINNKEIKKEYIAIVHGTPNPLSGVISAPIQKSGHGILRTISASGSDAKTIYRVIATKNNLSQVSLSPITGRTHQLRVHMAYISTPIYGDWLYNLNPSDGKTRLHCHKLTFIHPLTKKSIEISAPLPDDMNITNI